MKPFIPPASCVRYLGLYIDKRVTWNPHTRLKCVDLNRKFGQLRNLLHRRSKLSLGDKLKIYNMILKPTWTYGIELWGSARKSNIDRIQSFQSKTLRTILDAAWYVSNHTPHTDLNIPTVRQVLHSKLEAHPNPRPVLSVAIVSGGVEVTSHVLHLPTDQVTPLTLPSIRTWEGLRRYDLRGKTVDRLLVIASPKVAEACLEEVKQFVGVTVIGARWTQQSTATSIGHAAATVSHSFSSPVLPTSSEHLFPIAR
ncbi:hypothetical protein AAG570_004960 [Ranatra chinensis]|uniref:Uncharacterized protein n=1 Tax=Ranatra chinensis TaxID=642074 RepID=A0ABD0YDZ5_9HEMI